MSKFDFKEGLLDLSDFEDEKYEYFNKDTLFTFGNGDGQKQFVKDDIWENLHIGQMKLLLSEMQALIYYTDTTVVKNFVYIGAAHGFHIYVLAKLFPTFNFYLYDISTGWDKRLYQEENVFINNHYFEKDDIKYWQEKNEPLILVSDIRNLDVGDAKKKEEDIDAFEVLVDADMRLQEYWVKELKPYLALLKFRPPYPTDKITKSVYLDGVVFRQIFAKRSSAETRLLVKGIGYREWDLDVYDRMNAYFNGKIRTKTKYLNPVDGSKNTIHKEKGVMNDYESTAMTIIVMDYLKKINALVNKENVVKLLDFILDNCYSDKKINLTTSREMN